MRGVVFAGERKLEYLDFPDPTPGPGEVVLEIKASGICGSDLHFYRAPPGGGSTGLPGAAAAGPVIRGHEPCGQVAAIGPGVSPNEAKVGMRAMVHHYWGCTVCEHCRSGWAQMCDRQRPEIYGINAHGAHARYMKVPARTLVPLADELSFEAGAAIACGSGTAYAALRRLNVYGGSTVAVFGQGPVGLAGTQFAAAMGARVIAVDISPERLAQAKDLGADVTINPAKDEPIAAIKALTGGKGTDFALECSGSPDARVAAVRGVKLWGVACLVGVGGTVTLDVGTDLMQRQVTVFGSWTFSTVGQADCAAFSVKNKVPVDRVFTHRWTFDQADEAYRLTDKQVGGKGVILM
jgi:threonine dehydrogenase-like Zn-dependent dehydrogenase